MRYCRYDHSPIDCERSPIDKKLISIHSPGAKPGSSREAIKTELDGKLIFDDERVFRRLGIDCVQNTLVDECLASFNSDSNIRSCKKILDSLLLAKSDDEKKMYTPLFTIFEHIKQFDFKKEPRQFDRQWVPTANTTLKTDGDTWDFPLVSPDFTLLDISKGSPRHSSSNGEKFQHLWRHRSAFAEIKPNASLGPVPASAGVVKDIVAQSADYARLHMSAKPFQLFTYGLLIFGSKFCVAIYDRDGVLFSPTHDMWHDTPIFIRVIRRFTCDLSDVQLGQDPTVRKFPETEALTFQNEAKDLKIPNHTFPIYSINMGRGNFSWCTLGPPLWSSLSLLGRGTIIWRVCEPSNRKKVMVLKNAWRRSERLAESTIYSSIKGSHPGLVDFHFGDDVVFPTDTDRLITVSHLRDKGTNNEGNTPILHRLVFNTLGRPLWDYKTEIELLKGLRAALAAHRFLSEQGILHRDVSAGNIMLSARNDPPMGSEGFLMDMEFAHFDHSALSIKEKILVDPILGPGGVMTDETTRTRIKFDAVPVKRGAVMTGTLQFMAKQLLKAASRGQQIKHEVHHDIESFVWVLCYAVGRRGVSDPPTAILDNKPYYEELKAFFHVHYGRMDIAAIRRTRDSIDDGTLTLTESFPEIASEPLRQLFSALHDALMGHFLASRGPAVRNGSFPTYEFLQDLLDATIEKIQNLPPDARYP
ncbi:hypothetical protein K439DRAFT_1416273 [Ramaria rubella]|nr:hypothetical protein K439DRAFT_1416273 [Ramaria rubella]